MNTVESQSIASRRLSSPRLPVIALSLLCAMTSCTRAETPTAPPTPITATSSSVNGGDAVDWPRWQGADMNGVSPEGGWTTNWPEGGPKQLWKTNVGVGFSSVAVADGRLYTMGHETPEDAEEPAEKGGSKMGVDTVYCLDAATGEPIWEHSYPCKIVDNLHEGGPACTPTVHDGRVYTVSKEGHLFCLDAASGDVVWKREFSEDLGVKTPTWGFSCSPLVEDGLVIVDGGRVAAYNASSGELVWKTEEFPPGYGSAVAFDYAPDDGESKRLVAVFNNACLLLLHPKTGEEFARFDWTSPYETTSTTPLVVGDSIFISAGYRRGCALLKIGDGELTPVFENKDLCNHMNNSVLWEGSLYGFDGNSHNSRNVALTCLDFATGEEKWKERGLGCGSLMIAGGRLVCLSDAGELVIVEPSPEEYRELARAQILEGKCWTMPVLSGGRVYARDAQGDLVCVDVSGAAN